MARPAFFLFKSHSEVFATETFCRKGMHMTLIGPRNPHFEAAGRATRVVAGVINAETAENNHKARAAGVSNTTPRLPLSACVEALNAALARYNLRAVFVAETFQYAARITVSPAE